MKDSDYRDLSLRKNINFLQRFKMIKSILGWPLVFGARLIDAWPEDRHQFIRTFLWVFLLATIAGQLYDLADINIGRANFMEGMALTINNMVCFVKMFFLWKNRRNIEECLYTMEEDWKNNSHNEEIEMMSRLAKIARRIYFFLMSLHYCTQIAFIILAASTYDSRNINNEKRELIIRIKYPFNVYSSPVYEIFMLIGIAQGFLLIGSMVLADGLLITMTAHANGQLGILYRRILKFSSADDIPGIIENHQRIINFTENIDNIFKWIGLAEFLASSIIICSLGFVIITTVESDFDAVLMIKFSSYIFVMIFGVFIYCYAGDIIIDKSIKIRDAAYGSFWLDAPFQTSKVLILIMVRADKPLRITAGSFFAMDLESFINVLKTTASYLSVIKAMYE